MNSVSGPVAQLEINLQSCLSFPFRSAVPLVRRVAPVPACYLQAANGTVRYSRITPLSPLRLRESLLSRLVVGCISSAPPSNCFPTFLLPSSIFHLPPTSFLSASTVSSSTYTLASHQLYTTLSTRFFIVRHKFGVLNYAEALHPKFRTARSSCWKLPTTTNRLLAQANARLRLSPRDTSPTSTKHSRQLITCMSTTQDDVRRDDECRGQPVQETCLADG